MEEKGTFVERMAEKLHEDITKRADEIDKVRAARVELAKPALSAYMSYRKHEAKLGKKLDDVANRLSGVSQELAELRTESLLDASGIRRRSSTAKTNEANGVKENKLRSWLEFEHQELQDVVIPVNNVIMMKRLEETNEKELFLVGTMIQSILGCTPYDPETKRLRYFKYRFNEMAPDDREFQFRRTRVTDDGGVKRAATTASYRIHLPSRVIHNKFPFVIIAATCTVEMSTFEEGNLQVRPDMVFHSKSLPIDPKTGKLLDDADNRPLELYRHFSIRDHSASVFERCYSVNLVTPFPSIYVKHEAKNPGYTPKFELTFYLTEPIHRKVFQIYLPLTLMLLLHFFNMYIRKMDGASYVENTSSIALALVFLLPSMYPASKYKQALSANDAAVLLLFASIIIGVFRTPGLTETTTWGLLVDDVLPLSSIFVSIVAFGLFGHNWWQYNAIKKQIRKMNAIPGVNHKKGVEGKKGKPSVDGWALVGETMKYKGRTSMKVHDKKGSKRGENAANEITVPSGTWRAGYFPDADSIAARAPTSKILRSKSKEGRTSSNRVRPIG